MFLFLSISGVPSGWRIVVRNWYRVLNASIAIVFPFSSEISISFRGMISDIWMPMVLEKNQLC